MIAFNIKQVIQKGPFILNTKQKIQRLNPYIYCQFLIQNQLRIVKNTHSKYIYYKLFYKMKTCEPTEQNDYQAIISLMQQQDCSYEQALSHYNILNKYSNQTELTDHLEQSDYHSLEHHLASTYGGHSNEAHLNSYNSIPMTKKELLLIKQFIQGSPVSHPQKNIAFCNQICQKLKEKKKKLKCLKYLNPLKIWRLIKHKREQNRYKKISLEKSSISQNAKEEVELSPCWRQVMDDDLNDELETFKDELQKYLTLNKQLIKNIQSIANTQINVSQLDSIQVREQLKPLLICYQNSYTKFNRECLLQAQKLFKVICLSQRKFINLHNKIQGFSDKVICSIGSFNILDQLQIFSLLNKINKEELLAKVTVFKSFLIKNAFLNTIVKGQTNNISLVTQTSHQYHGQGSDEEDTDPNQIMTHKSIIQEQDMLYQSMLKDYHKKQVLESESNDYQIEREMIRESLKTTIKEEPITSKETYTIMFRTPNGQTITRNFMKNDSFQYIKDWIFTCQLIQFENEQTRTFDLYHGYPPKQIENQINTNLKDIFNEQESSIKLIIRQT